MLKGLIDQRNQDLWNLLNAKYDIKIVEDSSIGYYCDAQGNDIELTVNPLNINPASFTHELLHLHMRYHECFIGASVKQTIRYDVNLTELFSDELLDHIGNCLDHVKFLPTFLDMGFDKSEFISDYKEKKCTKKLLKGITQNYITRSRTNELLVDSYIGTVCAILADPNDRFDYSKEIKEFKKVDPKLFQLLQDLFIQWEKIDIESKDIMDDNYHNVTFTFGENLEEWFESTKFIDL